MSDAEMDGTQPVGIPQHIVESARRRAAQTASQRFASTGRSRSHERPRGRSTPTAEENITSALEAVAAAFKDPIPQHVKDKTKSVMKEVHGKLVQHVSAIKKKVTNL
jgi:hypothetical protein